MPNTTGPHVVASEVLSQHSNGCWSVSDAPTSMYTGWTDLAQHRMLLLVCVVLLAGAICTWQLLEQTWCVCGHASHCCLALVGLVSVWELHHFAGGCCMLLLVPQTVHGADMAVEVGACSATLCPS